METEGQRDFFRLLAGGVMPPVGVVMQEGVTGTFWLNILLTLMCGFPGIIHAAWVITSRDSEGNAVPGGTGRFVSLLFSYFAPPIGVFLTRGVSMRLLVNVMLTILCVVPATFTIFLAPLGLLPAIIHAVWEIATDVDEA